MTDEQLVLGRLATVFEAFPDVAPDRLLPATMTVVGSTRQRTGWRSRFTFVSRPALNRTAALAVAAVSALILVAAVSFFLGATLNNREPAATLPVIVPPVISPTPDASLTAGPEWRSASTDKLEIPIDYEAPDGVVVGVDEMRAFTLLSPYSDEYPVPQPGRPYVNHRYNGILVASLTDAYFRPCPRSSAYPLIRPGDDVLQALTGAGGLTFKTTSAQIDSRPAVIAELTDSACPAHDSLRVNSPPYDGHERSSETKVVHLASDEGSQRTYFVDLGETTVLIQIWSETDEQLSQWLPTAEQIVQSIHFRDSPAIE